MYRNFKRCIETIKALLVLRVKHFGRVLVPFAVGGAALGALFLGRGQPADDKGGPAGRKRSFSMQDRRTLGGAPSAAGGGLMLCGEVPLLLGWGPRWIKRRGLGR